MVGHEFELLENATGLEVAAFAAVASLDLGPNTFDWLTGDRRFTVRPYKLQPDSDGEVDYATDHVTVYGGGAKSREGRFEFGHIQADISEPTEEDHQIGRYSPPNPFIPRLLEVKDGVITVDTPSVLPPAEEEPIVLDGTRFRRVTSYDTRTGLITVRTTVPNTSAYDSRREDIAITEIPAEYRQVRVAILIRTIRTAGTIFEKMAWKDKSVTTSVQRNSER